MKGFKDFILRGNFVELTAVIVFFFVVKPYEAAKVLFSKTRAEATSAPDIILLTQIRDLLSADATRK